MKVWLNGRLVEPRDAQVSVFDHGLTVGDGVFETVKVSAGRPFALTRHLRRLAASARGMGLPEPDLELARTAVAELLHSVAGEGVPAGAQHRLRVTYTGGTSPLGSDRGDARPTLVVALAPLAPWPATAAVATVAWPRNERGALAGLKTTSYAENVVALAYAKACGAGEAVFGNTAGQLCEGTGSNVFLEHDGRLVTPTLASGCLAGVTRALLLEWCEVEERDVPLGAIREAREVFLTSSTRDVQPVHAVDGQTVRDGAPGPTTAAVKDLFARRCMQDRDP